MQIFDAVYALLPREAILCLADGDANRLVQLAVVLGVGSRAVWPVIHQAFREQIPLKLRDRVVLVLDWTLPTVVFDAVLHHGCEAASRDVCRSVAAQPGPIFAVQSLSPGETTVQLDRLVVERALSVNTAAAGGNASLMMIG